MNRLRRLRCFVRGHELRRIGAGYLLLIFECEQCGQTLMSHRHYPGLLPVRRDALADVPSVVLDATRGH